VVYALKEKRERKRERHREIDRERERLDVWMYLNAKYK
jgi:hypothetical protein